MDHDQRRTELVEAAWRVIRRDGVEHASVRQVAREAKVSMGALRYVFDSQDALLRFAMQAVRQRVRARIEARLATAPGAMHRDYSYDLTVELLEQVLPMDDERLTEAQIWLAFAHRALIDPQLRSLRRTADDGLQALCRRCLIGLSGLGLMAPDRDLRLETERLWALIDGLIPHLAAGHTSRRMAHDVLRAHVDQLG